MAKADVMGGRLVLGPMDFGIQHIERGEGISTAKLFGPGIV